MLTYLRDHRTHSIVALDTYDSVPIIGIRMCLYSFSITGSYTCLKQRGRCVFSSLRRYALVKTAANVVSPALFRHQNFLGGRPHSTDWVP